MPEFCCDKCGSISHPDECFCRICGSSLGPKTANVDPYQIKGDVKSDFGKDIILLPLQAEFQEGSQSRREQKQHQFLEPKCTRCGKLPDNKIDAICVSKTRWGYVPAGMVTSALEDMVVDQEKWWTVFLCNKCCLIIYVDHLQAAIRGQRKFLAKAPIVLFASLSLFVLYSILAPKQSLPLDGIVLVLIAVPFIAAIWCILGITITAIKILRDSTLLKITSTKMSVPRERIGKVFEHEAHRLLESLEKGRKDYYGSFDLPAFSTGTRPGRVREVSFREVSIVTSN